MEKQGEGEPFSHPLEPEAEPEPQPTPAPPPAEKRFRLWYVGSSCLDRRTTLPMLPWLVAEIRRRGQRQEPGGTLGSGVPAREVLLLLGWPTLRCVPAGPGSPGRPGSPAPTVFIFEHKPQHISRFIHNSHDLTYFAYLIKAQPDNPDSLMACHVFRATDPNQASGGGDRGRALLGIPRFSFRARRMGRQALPSAAAEWVGVLERGTAALAGSCKTIISHTPTRGIEGKRARGQPCPLRYVRASCRGVGGGTGIAPCRALGVCRTMEGTRNSGWPRGAEPSPAPSARCTHLPGVGVPASGKLRYAGRQRSFLSVPLPSVGGITFYPTTVPWQVHNFHCEQSVEFALGCLCGTVSILKIQYRGLCFRTDLQWYTNHPSRPAAQIFSWVMLRTPGPAQAHSVVLQRALGLGGDIVGRVPTGKKDLTVRLYFPDSLTDIDSRVECAADSFLLLVQSM